MDQTASFLRLNTYSKPSSDTSQLSAAPDPGNIASFASYSTKPSVKAVRTSNETPSVATLESRDRTSPLYATRRTFLAASGVGVAEEQPTNNNEAKMKINIFFISSTSFPLYVVIIAYENNVSTIISLIYHFIFTFITLNVNFTFNPYNYERY